MEMLDILDERVFTSMKMFQVGLASGVMDIKSCHDKKEYVPVDMVRGEGFVVLERGTLPRGKGIRSNRVAKWIAETAKGRQPMYLTSSEIKALPGVVFQQAVKNE